MKKKTLTTLIVLVLVFGALGGLYTLMILKIGSLSSDVTANVSSLAISKSKAESLRTITSDTKGTLKLHDDLNAVFVPDANAPDFIQSIQTIMDSQNISGKIDTVSDVPNTTLDPLNKEDLLLSLEADGSYASLMRFASLLESIPYKSYIVSFDLAENDVSSQTVDKTVVRGSWHLILTLDVIKTKPITPAASS